MLTEQYKNIQRRIFLSPEGLDHILEFLMKMWQKSEDIKNSKVTTPESVPAVIDTPKPTNSTENITNGFKYAFEQEMYLMKSVKNESSFPTKIPFRDPHCWTKELRLYESSQDPDNFPINVSEDITRQDYELIFGNLNSDIIQEPINNTPSSIELEILNLESHGFSITKLEDYNNHQTLVIKDPTSCWTVILHILENMVKEWQFLERNLPNKTCMDREDFLDINLTDGNLIEILQILLKRNIFREK